PVNPAQAAAQTERRSLSRSGLGAAEAVRRLGEPEPEGGEGETVPIGGEKRGAEQQALCSPTSRGETGLGRRKAAALSLEGENPPRRRAGRPGEDASSVPRRAGGDDRCALRALGDARPAEPHGRGSRGEKGRRPGRVERPVPSVEPGTRGEPFRPYQPTEPGV